MPLLTETDREQLTALFKYHHSYSVRRRAHSILLSTDGFTIDEIACIYQVHRDTVRTTFDRWETKGLDGLFDGPKSGRPPKLSSDEADEVVKLLKEDPRSIKKALTNTKEKTGKTISEWTVKRIAKHAGLRWKRMRKSHKSKRDETLFRQAQAEIEVLKAQSEAGEIDLVYFDESGFSLIPVVPYAWQPIGKTMEIPSVYSRRLNVLGFFSRNNHSHNFTVEGSVNSAVVINCFDQFVETLSRQTVVIIDNAPTHTSRKFRNKLEAWAYKGLLVRYLPTYSSELNLIEIVWKFIKYQWLPLSAYQSFAHLKTAVQNILDGIGSKYQITFA